ncbi:hypothetical protein ACTFIU_003167 [Dictyostelium citrinum]
MHKLIIYCTPEHSENLKKELFERFIGKTHTYEHVVIQSRVTQYFKLSVLKDQSIELDKLEFYVSDESNRIFNALDYLKENLPNEHCSFESYHLGNNGYIGFNK